MRHIHLDDGLKLRFPGRCEEFDQGVEIGMLAVLMDSGIREFRRRIARANLGQVRALAGQLGYLLVEEDGGEGDFVEVTLRQRSARPALRIVHSAG